MPAVCLHRLAERTHPRVRLPLISPNAPVASSTTATTAITVIHSSVPHPAVFISLLASVGFGVG